MSDIQHDSADNLQPPALLPREVQELRSFAAAMIPSSAEFAVPGADDEQIFAAILYAANTRASSMVAAIARLIELSGGSFAGLDDDSQQRVAGFFRRESPTLAWQLSLLVASHYYRDDRVMRALGMETRAPFPKGFDVEQGDWTLLEPVRCGPKRYRDVNS